MSSGKKILLALLVALAIAVVGYCVVMAKKSAERRYYQTQNRIIEALIAEEFADLSTLLNLCRHNYLDDAILFDHFPALQEYLSGQIAMFTRTNSGYEICDKETGKTPDIFEHRDWKTIHALVRDSNTLLAQHGRLACEFDGGYNVGATSFTTNLFNVAYLRLQSQQLAFREGRYELLKDGESGIPLDIHDLLKRNAIARVLCYRLLSETTSSLLRREQARADATGSLPETLTYAELNRYYTWIERNWQGFLKTNIRVGLSLTETGFDAIDLETNEKLAFPHDQDLIDEALKELNYYREKVNFSEHFMLGNYPVFLLSILRLYDVSLQKDEKSGKVVIVPGPTDPEAFFDLVAECTFVNDPSDTEYLKEHLTSWLEIVDEYHGVLPSDETVEEQYMGLGLAMPHF
jgi:hypothetical protein